MTDSYGGTRGGLCPRLVDYFCIVGSNSHPHRPYGVEAPELLTRYPPIDHRDFPLPRDMVYFCQPDGCTYTSPRRPQARETHSFVFTLTDKDSGITRYGICLNFYRGVERRGGPPAANKRDSWTRCTDRSTDSAFSSDYKSHSTFGPSDSDREREEHNGAGGPNITITLNERDEKGFKGIFLGEPKSLASNGPKDGGGAEGGHSSGEFSNLLAAKANKRLSGAGGGDSDCDPDVPRTRRRENNRSNVAKTQSLTSICVLSHHPFFSSFRTCLSTLKRLVEASSTANSRWKGGHGSRGASGRREADLVWSVLAGGGLDNSPSSFLLHDIREIESWIQRLLSAPIPVSGRTRLELEIIDRRFGPLLIFAIPDQTRLNLCDFPLHLPLELLGVDTTLQVLTLILMEYKVLVQSKDLNALSLSVLALTHLLYPLQYMFPVIPLLPTSMPDAEQLLLAPTPYIIGVPSSFLVQKKHITVPDDVWLVDLDSGKLTCPTKQTMDEIPPLPEPEGKILKSHLKQVLSSMAIQPISNFDLITPEKMAALLRNSKEVEDNPGGYNPLIYGNDVDSVDIATRVAMVRFFNSPNVLANFTEHTRTLRLYPRPVVAFQSGSLVRSRPKHSPFLTKFVSSQAVEFYAEWILMPSNLAFQRIHTGVFDPTIIGDKFKWYAHNLEPVSFVVWDNLSSLNQSLQSIKDPDTLATDESGSDSECCSSSSSFSSISDIAMDGNQVSLSSSLGLGGTSPLPGHQNMSSSLGLEGTSPLQQHVMSDILYQGGSQSEFTLWDTGQGKQHVDQPFATPALTVTGKLSQDRQMNQPPMQIAGHDHQHHGLPSEPHHHQEAAQGDHHLLPSNSVMPVRGSDVHRSRSAGDPVVPHGGPTGETSHPCGQPGRSRLKSVSPRLIMPQQSHPITSEFPRGCSLVSPPVRAGQRIPSLGRYQHTANRKTGRIHNNNNLPGSRPDKTDMAARRSPRSSYCANEEDAAGGSAGDHDADGVSPWNSVSVPYTSNQETAESSVCYPSRLDSNPACLSSHQNQVPHSTFPRRPNSPPSSEESVSESTSPLPDENLHKSNSSKLEGSERNGDDAQTSESENSSATTKTIRNLNNKKFSPTTSGSFGSQLSLIGSDQELAGITSNIASEPTASNNKQTHRVPTPLSKFTTGFSVKFPRTRFSESSSSSTESRKPSESRQSSTEDVAQELFHNIEQFTKQAKKAAESLEKAAESLETAGKSAMQASKSKVIGKGYTNKDKKEDPPVAARKSVVDDIRSAVEKKTDLFKSLSDSAGDKKESEEAAFRPIETAVINKEAVSTTASESREDVVDKALVIEKSSNGLQDRQLRQEKRDALQTQAPHQFERKIEQHQQDNSRRETLERRTEPIHHPGPTNRKMLMQSNHQQRAPQVPNLPNHQQVQDIKRQSRCASAGGGISDRRSLSSSPSPRALPPAPRGPPPLPPPPKGPPPVPPSLASQVPTTLPSAPVSSVVVPPKQPLAAAPPVPTTELTSAILPSVASCPPPLGLGVEPPLPSEAPSPLAPSPKITAAMTSPVPSFTDGGCQDRNSKPDVKLPLSGQSIDEKPPQTVEMSGLNRQLSNLSTRSAATEGEVFDDTASVDSSTFFSNIGTDLSGLANQTSDFIGGLFVGQKTEDDQYGRGTRSTPGSQKGSPSHTPRNSVSRNSQINHQQQGPFPRGRRGIVERSSLIRHPSSRTMSAGSSQQATLEQKNAISTENLNFIKEVVEQVLAGEGVGWLKMSRLKKLMEDENYRNLLLNKLNKSADKRLSSDDHVEDVCVKRTVYKGMLKILLAVIHGLEMSLANFGVGGLASAYQLLEISHTHFWSKDPYESGELSLSSIGGGSHTAPNTTNSSPIESKDINERINNSLQVPPSPRSLEPEEHFNSLSSREDSGGSSRKSSHSEREYPEQTVGDMIKEQLYQKKQLLFGRIASVDSETDNESCANSESGSIITNPAFQRSRSNFSSVRSTVSDTEVESNLPSSRGVSADLWPSKSSKTSGYRYRGGGMLTTVKTPTLEINRVYLFEAILGKERSVLWDNPQFWEDIFLDAVAQERELVGMDSGTEAMMERYRGLCENEKKRLEHEEDRLLSTMLFNLVAFMLMMNVNKTEIKKKVRRLLGKSHIGMIHSQEIYLLLDKMHHLSANDIDLKPLLSRQVHRQSFAVHAGIDNSGDLLFLEVRDDGMVLRTINGTISERWFFERLVNMTYSPKNKVLCLWRRHGGQTQLHKYYTKKCRDLYYCIKSAMEKAASRIAAGAIPGMELGGEFPVQDINTGEGGLLQVCMEGVGLLFENSKFFVRLEHIRKCYTEKSEKGGTFVLEEFNPKSRKIVERRYICSMADQICYAVLCVFSYVAAGQDKKIAALAPSHSTRLSAAKKNSAAAAYYSAASGSTGYMSAGGLSPRGQLFPHGAGGLSPAAGGPSSRSRSVAAGKPHWSGNRSPNQQQYHHHVHQQHHNYTGGQD